MGSLYKLNFENAKSYIGITSKPMRRRISLHLSQARNGRNGALQNAIRKYGDESFTCEVLATCDDWECLCLMEKRAILAFKTRFPDGYNLTDGGEGTVGYKASSDTKKKLSVAHKGKGLGNTHALGFKHAEETKRKISEAGKGRIFSEEARAKIGATKVGNKYNVGKPCSTEKKLKIASAQIGRPLSEQHKKALAGIHKGKPWSAARRAAQEKRGQS